ncbi:hypothetical protein C8A00DRAFT_31169 [Chaetomidium leptoderma]|uniref:Uncharacterized protein n=1 Tax=Chaetomidium leptoderma TaxID=669021 RepID=A0AAN6ZXV0_9PEZI|nr:hypothetical protein C8A00DRAFT_31169 [Chaetomidium leptoderma]
MAPYARLFLLLGAIAPVLAQGTTTTSASDTFNLFVIDPLGPVPSPTIYASIVRADPSLSQTEYWISCQPFEDDDYQGPLPPAPCHYIHGATVTINPTGMTLQIRRESQLIRAVPTEGLDVNLTKETFITVTGTATCRIDGTTTASCTGHVTSSPTTITHTGSSTWGTKSSVETETISSAFADVTAHSIPVTVTAGFSNLPTTSTPSSTTRSSTAGGAKVTGLAQAVLAGAVALAGGVALV